MFVNAKIKVKNVQVNLEQDSVYIEAIFQINNIPERLSNKTFITVPLPDELRKYCEDIIVAKVGEFVESDQEILF